jgi:hypothetical protein
MHYRAHIISTLSIVVFLLFVPAKPAHAEPHRGDEVVLGDDLTLREGEHVDGDLVIIGGDLIMQADSRVAGSVMVLGGRVEVNGVVEGDLVAFGGRVDLGAQARINGDTVALGGRVTQAPGAQSGDIVEGPAIRNVRVPFFPMNLSARPRAVIGAVVTTLVVAAIMALLGIAIAAFWPSQTAQVGETILNAPLPSLGVGCLVYPLAASLVVFVVITICLAPFVPVAALLLVAASLLGWVSLGRLFGRWLARWTGWRGATPLAVTGAGVFALTVVAAVLGAVPCLGFVLVLGASSIGVGAVALSRFGTSSYGSRVVDSAAES